MSDGMRAADSPPDESVPTCSDHRSAAAYADLTVSATRNFAAIFRVCRLAGAGRARSIEQANTDTIRSFGLNLVERASVSDLLELPLQTTAESRTNVGLFAHALLERQLVQALRPALAIDVISLYLGWCERLGCRAFATPMVLNAMRVDFGVRAERIRYVDGGAVHGPHSVLWLSGDHGVPVGVSRPEWVGQQVAMFRQSVAEYLAPA